MSRATWPAWLKRYLRSHRRDVAAALALGLAASGCAALLMFTSGYLISATALAATTLFSIMVPVACVQLFGFGRPLARYLERLVSHDWVLHVTSDLRLALYRSIARRMEDPALERATGEYLSLLSDDVAHLQNLYLRVVFPAVVAYLLALGTSVLFGFFSWPYAGLVLVALAVVVVLLPRAALLATRLPLVQAKTQKEAELVDLADDVYGAADWMLSGRSEAALDRHAQADSQIRAFEASARMRQRSLSLAATLALGILLCTVVVWAAQSFGSAQPHANWIAAFALGFFPLIESFAVLPAALSETTLHQESVERLDAYLAYDSDASGNAPLPAPASLGGNAIRIAGLTYAYPGMPAPALHDLALSIPSGQSVAILGRSGSGKSTLARLASGQLAPDSGTIALFGRNLDARSDASATVGYLGQSPYLFNRTLRENLTLGGHTVADDKLIDCLRAVGLGAKFQSLPHGLDTVVGETGVGFSGGEEHRIALARILVADTPLVVLDEPFSALDPDTERELLDLLFVLFSNRTLVVVTHHLAEIERFDRVLFLEDGTIRLDGSPADLARTNDRFRQLVDFDRG